MPGSRRSQHDDQRDGNTTWCVHPTIPLLDFAAGLQPLPGDQINALNQRRLLALGKVSDTAATPNGNRHLSAWRPLPRHQTPAGSQRQPAGPSCRWRRSGSGRALPGPHGQPAEHASGQFSEGFSLRRAHRPLCAEPPPMTYSPPSGRPQKCSRVQKAAGGDRGGGRPPLSYPPANAAPRLRLRARPWPTRHSGDPGMARAPQHPAACCLWQARNVVPALCLPPRLRCARRLHAAIDLPSGKETRPLRYGQLRGRVGWH